MKLFKIASVFSITTTRTHTGLCGVSWYVWVYNVHYVICHHPNKQAEDEGGSRFFRGVLLALNAFVLFCPIVSNWYNASYTLKKCPPPSFEKSMLFGCHFSHKRGRKICRVIFLDGCLKSLEELSTTSVRYVLFKYPIPEFYNNRFGVIYLTFES